MLQQLKTVHPDIKGRITLGALAKGISSFAIFKDDENHLILVPYVEIPAKEKWLFENPKALAQARKGLQDSASGKVRKLGSFKKHLHQTNK